MAMSQKPRLQIQLLLHTQHFSSFQVVRQKDMDVVCTPVQVQSDNNDVPTHPPASEGEWQDSRLCNA